MSKATVNLSAPYSVRLRHDQEKELTRIIERMTADQMKAMKDKDRSKFLHSDLFKNKGRATNPIVLMIRSALDDYLSKHKSSLDDLPLFRNVSEDDEE